MTQPFVLITRRLSGRAPEILQQANLEVRCLDQNGAPPREALLAQIHGAAGAIVVLSDRIDAEFLDAAGPSLRVVANYAVGIDNIELAACRTRNVRVTNTPGVLSEATADLAWTLILGACRRVIEGDRLVREGRWSGWYPTELMGVELNGATLGIVGAGQIGSAVARRAQGFCMRVLYSHPRPNADIEADVGATRVELDDLLRQSDIVSLHIPMRPENRHLLDARRLALLKDGAVLINTARGAVIDEAALLAELRTGRIRAGLDVYEQEPRLTPGLTDMPNVVLLPHLGSATTATRANMAALAAKNVIAVLAGREPTTPVA